MSCIETHVIASSISPSNWDNSMFFNQFPIAFVPFCRALILASTTLESLLIPVSGFSESCAWEGDEKRQKENPRSLCVFLRVIMPRWKSIAIAKKSGKKSDQMPKIREGNYHVCSTKNVLEENSCYDKQGRKKKPRPEESRHGRQQSAKSIKATYMSKLIKLIWFNPVRVPCDKLENCLFIILQLTWFTSLDVPCWLLESQSTSLKSKHLMPIIQRPARLDSLIRWQTQM